MDLVEERPEFWVFMNGRDFAAPRVDLAMLPRREASVLFGNTALVRPASRRQPRYPRRFCGRRLRSAFAGVRGETAHPRGHRECAGRNANPR
jgi:hypothetical protein